MQKLKLPETIRTVIEQNSGLKVYLKNLAHGRAETPRSWEYENLSPEQVKQLWLKQLDAVKTTPHGEDLYHFDTSQLEKWGPQGGVAPLAELMPLIEATFAEGDSPIPQLFRTAEWKKAKAMAVRYMKRAIPLHSLKPRAYESVVDDMAARDTLSSNSGMPDFGRRMKPDILRAAIAAAENGTWKEYPAIPLFRNYNLKTRLVWMYPLSTNIVEGSFTQPLKEAIMRSDLDFFVAWRGWEHVLALVTSRYTNPATVLSASDFTSTDTHFTRWAIMEVYDVIKNFYVPEAADLLRESMLRVTKIPLVLSGEEMLVGWHGVSSGSNWTNDVETYFDLILQCYLVLIGVIEAPLFAIGDDMAMQLISKLQAVLPEKLTLVGEAIGQIINESKVTNDPDSIKTLQRKIYRDYFSRRQSALLEGGFLLRGIYPTCRALKSLVYPEKFHSPKLWSMNMFCVRQYMIIENCVDHPLFEQFVKFAVDGKHDQMVAFARKSSAEQEEILRQSRLLPGLNPTYNQEKRDTSLASYASIKLARRM